MNKFFKRNILFALLFSLVIPNVSAININDTKDKIFSVISTNATKNNIIKGAFAGCIFAAGLTLSTITLITGYLSNKKLNTFKKVTEYLSANNLDEKLKTNSELIDIVKNMSSLSPRELKTIQKILTSNDSKVKIRNRRDWSDILCVTGIIITIVSGGLLAMQFWPKSTKSKIPTAPPILKLLTPKTTRGTQTNFLTPKTKDLKIDFTFTNDQNKPIQLNFFDKSTSNNRSTQSTTQESQPTNNLTSQNNLQEKITINESSNFYNQTELQIISTAKKQSTFQSNTSDKNKP